VGVVVAINVQDGQDKDIHLVEQAGHLRITAIGGQSLRKIGKQIVNSGCLYTCLSCLSRCLPYLFDKPLAESRSDPLPRVDTTIHEDSGFGGAGFLTELWWLKVIIKH